MTTAPRASIVTAVHEFRACEELWLEAMIKQTLPSEEFEVIMVDAVGHPTYRQLMKEFCSNADHISYHQIPAHGRARALNHALSIAKSDLIIFLADDFVAGPELVASHLKFHEENPDPETVGIGAGLVPQDLSTDFTMWLERTGRFFGMPFYEGMTSIPEDFFYVGNASVTRKLLNRAGAFDEIFLFHAGDDFEFGQRLRAAGMKAQLVTTATASHRHYVLLEDRAEAFRQLGQNARAVAERSGEATWLRSLKLSAPVWSPRVAAARASMLISNSSASRQRWWRVTLEAAFASGYRRGQNGSRSK
jgi:GT2 family glycosyltransferase